MQCSWDIFSMICNCYSSTLLQMFLCHFIFYIKLKSNPPYLDKGIICSFFPISHWRKAGQYIRWQRFDRRSSGISSLQECILRLLCKLYMLLLHTCVVSPSVLDRYKTRRSSASVIVVTRDVVQVVISAQLLCNWITCSLFSADFEDVLNFSIFLVWLLSTVREV